MTPALLLLGGWLPILALALIRRSEWRPGRVLFGAALAGFVGGVASVELRRHGILASSPGALPLPLLGLCLDEILRFAWIGGAGALAGEILLSRLEARATRGKENGKEVRP